MKSIKILSMVAVMIAVGLLSCKEEEKTVTPTPPVIPNYELITTGTWKLSARTNVDAVDIDGKDGPSKDLYSQMTECWRDDTIKFDSVGVTLRARRYAVKKCSGDPAIDTKTWSFSSDEKQLNWDGKTYDIKELNTSKMIINYKFSIPPDNYDVTETYVH